MTATTTSQRDPGRWMLLFACIVAVLMTAIDAGVGSGMEVVMIQSAYSKSILSNIC
jgi:hypothetical protein